MPRAKFCADSLQTASAYKEKTDTLTHIFGFKCVRFVMAAEGKAIIFYR